MIIYENYKKKQREDPGSKITIHPRSIIKHRLFQDSIWVGFGQISTILISLISSAILARVLTVEVLGRYQLIISYLGIASIAGLPGMDIVIRRGIFKRYDNICWSAVKQGFFTSLIGAMILFLVGLLVFIKDWHKDVGFSLMATAVLLPSRGLQKYDSVFVGKRDFFTSRTIAVISSLINLSIVATTAFLTRRLMPILCAFFFSQLLVLALGWYLAYKKLEKTGNDETFEKELLKQGWQQSFLSIVNVIGAQFDRILIGSINPANLAIYHVGQLIVRQIKNNVKTFLGVPVAHWAAESKKENYRRICTYGGLFFTIGVCFTLGIWVLSPFFIPFIFGQKYVSSVKIAQWLSISLGPLFLTPAIWAYDLYQKQGKAYIKVQSILRIFQIIALSIMVPLYSIKGAVLVVVCSECLFGLFAVLYFIKEGRNC